MTPSLYARLLGPAWDELDESLRRGRGGGAGARGRGVFRVERDRGLLGRVLGGLLRLPAAAEAVAVELSVEPTARGERWVRRFGSRRFATTARAAAGGLFAERFRVFEFRFRLTPLGGAALEARQVEAGLCLGPLWLPLPPALAPRVWGREEAAGEGAGPRVRVRIDWPGARRLLEYEGRAVFEEVRG
jgi:hypothetical protein